MNNKGELELYQIPVVSVQGLAYGDYTVTLWVNKAVNSNYDFLNRGGQFHFDGIRIYEPLETEKEILSETERLALDAYFADKEAYSYIKEIRNVLLSATDFYALTDKADGAVFVDVNSSIVDPNAEAPDSQEQEGSDSTNVTLPTLSTEGYNALTIDTYNKIGPKNEVYLSPDQAVAFMLKIDSKQTPVTIDIGAKTIQGDSVTLAAGFVAGLNNAAPITLTKVVADIHSSTAQYFALNESSVPDGEDIYLILYNASEKKEGQKDTASVLSITDLKIAYNVKPNEVPPEDRPTDPEIKGMAAHTTAPVRFMVDNRAGEAVRTFLRSLNETPVDEETDVPAVQGDVRIYHSLNLASDISVNFLVPKTDLEGFDLSTVYMESILEDYAGNTRNGTTSVRLTPVEKDGYYYFTLTGLTAVQMTDCISTTLYGVKEGRTCCSVTDEYSIASYAYSQLNKVGVPDSLKIICADLLRYGGKAQLYKSYRTDNLADDAMTDIHRTFLSDLDSVNFGNTNRILDDLENAPISWTGKSLNLESKVALKFAFNPVNYQGDPSTLTLKASYTDINGEFKTLTVGNPELYNPDMGLYVFTLDALLAAELRTVVSVQIFAGNIPVSCTLQYSADTYGNNKTGKLLELCKALFAYSDSARSYFA